MCLLSVVLFVVADFSDAHRIDDRFADDDIPLDDLAKHFYDIILEYLPMAW